MTTSILIRDLPIEVKRGLRQMALAHERSMEEEARHILRAAVTRATKKMVTTELSFAQKIHARFAAVGGVELKTPPRDDWRAIPNFEIPIGSKQSRRV